MSERKFKVKVGSSESVKKETLIRSLIYYIKFGNLVICNTNLLKVERIQRKAIKLSLNLSSRTSTNEVYKKTNIEKIIDRSKKLTSNYLCKSVRTNRILKELIEKYKANSEHAEGSYCNCVPRTTIFGFLQKENQLECSRLFN